MALVIAIVVVSFLRAGYTWCKPSQKLHTPHNPISSPHSELQDAQIDNSDARTQPKDTQIALKMSESNVLMLKDEVNTLKDELADLQSELATANGTVDDLFTLADHFVKDQRQLQGQIADTWERLKTERTEVEV
jgi:chromosome segregation ATPase